MKVHPAPTRCNITFRYEVHPSLLAAEVLLGRHRKLRRLPHVFSKVLELPFTSDVDVEIQEDVDSFYFAVSTDDLWNQVRAHAIEIHPGVTKVVIRDGDDGLELPVDDLELDRWRFRLPPSTRPDLATADYVDGELIVTVPKGEECDDSGRKGGVCGEGNGDLSGGGVGRLIAVQ